MEHLPDSDRETVICQRVEAVSGWTMDTTSRAQRGTEPGFGRPVGIKLVHLHECSARRRTRQARRPRSPSHLQVHGPKASRQGWAALLEPLVNHAGRYSRKEQENSASFGLRQPSAAFPASGQSAGGPAPRRWRDPTHSIRFMVPMPAHREKGAFHDPDSIRSRHRPLDDRETSALPATRNAQRVSSATLNSFNLSMALRR